MYYNSSGSIIKVFPTIYIVAMIRIINNLKVYLFIIKKEKEKIKYE